MTVAGVPGVRAGPIAGDHLDAGMLVQPCRQRLGAPVGQQRDRATPLEVNQYGPVAMPLADRPVVHAEMTVGISGSGSGARRISLSNVFRLTGSPSL